MQLSYLYNVVEQIKKTYNFGLLYMPNNDADGKVTNKHGDILGEVVIRTKYQYTIHDQLCKEKF